MIELDASAILYLMIFKIVSGIEESTMCPYAQTLHAAFFSSLTHHAAAIGSKIVCKFDGMAEATTQALDMCFYV